jgi:hypothetical protein
MAIDDLLNIPAVQAFLFDGKILATFRDVATKHGIVPERAPEFLDLCNAVLDDKLPMAEMPAIIAEAFGIDEKAATEVAKDIIGERVLPLEAFVPGVKEQIIAWGGNPEDYAAFRLHKERVTSLEWSGRLASAANIGFSDVLLKRLAFLLEGRMNGQKSAEALRTFFGRALTIGGLGLVKEQNDALIKEIEGEAPYIELVSAEELEKIKAEAAEDAKEEAEEEDELPIIPAEVVSTELEVSPSHEVAAEVPVISERKVAVTDPDAQVPDAVAVKKARTLSNSAADMLREAFEEALQQTLEEAAPLLKKKLITEKQFADLAGKAIRGIRDLGKTRDILEAEYKVKKEDSAQYAEAIQKGITLYESLARGEEAELEPAVAEAIEEAEAVMMNRRFAALTNSSPGAPLQTPMPGARVSAARLPGDEVKLRHDAMTEEMKRKAAEAERPKLAKAELTLGSVAPSDAHDRKMTDVVTATRLVGPVEQLRLLGPVEFRRLSSNPAEAAKKVEDLLTALEETSYEEKVKGIKAWRESPMTQLYVQMTEEALSEGISLPEISSRRRSAGKESLSPAEIKALVELSARLRF